MILMEALRRTGGWSLLLSVLPFTVYPLFAGARWLGPLRGQQSSLEQATAYHTLSNESVLGIPIQAFADTVIGFLVFGTALMMTGAGSFSSILPSHCAAHSAAAPRRSRSSQAECSA